MAHSLLTSNVDASLMKEETSGLSIGRPSTWSVGDPDCVKTCTDQKSLESYSNEPPITNGSLHSSKRQDVSRAPEV